MKKLALVVLPGLVMLAGSLVLFSGNSNEAKLDSSLPMIKNARSMDLTTGMAAPGKDGVPNQEAINAKAASLAVPFIKNVGQFNSEVKYAADLFAGRFFLTDKELVYSLLKRSGKKNARQDKHEPNAEPEKSMPGKGLAFREFFVNKNGTKINFRSSGEQQAATVVSYFKGKDPSKWRSEIASYRSVSLGQVYPGVEVKLKASGKNVEKIFYVSPQTDVADIKIGVAGIAALEISNDGRLLLKNRLGELAMRAPIAWQEINGRHLEVKVSYRLLGKKQYGFAVSGDYDKNHALVIDPELEILLASTFLGGNEGDIGTSLALDSSGNIYLTGKTASADFPTTPGAYDGAHNAGYYTDAFISKFNNDLTVLLASTYLGGNNYDWGDCLALDSMGNVFLTGHTTSADFPITLGAYDQTKNGAYGDVFITKLNNNLTILLASTYLGGSNGAGSSSLALDNSDNVYVAGNTYSTDFPTTSGAFDVTTDRLHDIFISKLNSDLTMLLASTFLGWRLEDYERYGNRIKSLALDSFGNVYVTGSTDSADFPTTPGAYDRTYNGFGRFWADGKESGSYYDRDVFIAKLNGNLSTLMASTYLGWSDPSVARTVFPNPYNEIGYSLTLDSSGNVFVTGDTTSSGFPTTAGAYDQTYSGDENNGDAFVAKFNNELTALLASTYLGGNKDDSGHSLALDSGGKVYLIGITWSADFPTTPGAYNQTHACLGFVSKLDRDLTTLLASTYLPGRSNSLALDSAGNVYLTGYANSKSFPTTPMAYDQTYNDKNSMLFFNNYEDAFIAKLGSGLKVILDLQAERREIRAFRILSYYGLIQFTVDDVGIPIAEYRLYHRAGNGPYSLIRTILPHELQNNRFQMQDKFLDKDTEYTYIVEAFNTAGQLVGRSAEKTI